MTERELYQLQPPLIITSRFLGGLAIENAGTVHIEPQHRDPEGRVVYRWFIDDAEGHEIGRGEDLRSGVGEDVDHRSIIKSLLSFLDACAEAQPDGENAHLFPKPVAEWAEAHQDAIAMAQVELEGGEK